MRGCAMLRNGTCVRRRPLATGPVRQGLEAGKSTSHASAVVLQTSIHRIPLPHPQPKAPWSCRWTASGPRPAGGGRIRAPQPPETRTAAACGTYLAAAGRPAGRRPAERLRRRTRRAARPLAAAPNLGARRRVADAYGAPLARPLTWELRQTGRAGLLAHVRLLLGCRPGLWLTR